ncbi:MAG TPA: hypothetical protein VIY86_00880, partial [Pirellulaceae bacterium]
MRPRRIWQLVVIALVSVLTMDSAWSQTPESGSRRARRPNWKRGDGKDIFFEDAIRDALRGSPPDDRADSNITSLGNAALGSETSALGEVNRTARSWSDDISTSCLEAEIKSQYTALHEALRGRAHFAREGYRSAETSLVMGAVGFEIVRQHSGDVRWKSIASSARDRLGQFHQEWESTPQDGSQWWSLARKALVEWGGILNGGTIEPKPGSPLAWHDIADRRVLMVRLEEAADVRLAAALADEESWRR